MKKRAWLLIPMALLLMAAGCSSDDDNQNPPQGQTMTQQQAEAYVSFILADVNTFVGGWDSWAIITRGGDRTDEPGWDGTAWSWEDTYHYDHEGTTIDWTFDYWLQYLGTDGLPVQYFEAANSMHVIYSGDMSSTDQNSSTDFEYDWDMTYTGLQTSVVNMSGTGDWIVSVTDTQGTFEYAMGWATGSGGIDIPLSGCPDGMMIWDLPPYELRFDFNNPAGNVTWTLYEGSSQISSGSEVMDCN